MIGWTLGRYFFIRYIRITFYFVIGIFTLAMLIDFSENAGRLASLPGYSALGAFALSALRIPFIMQQLFPFVALFSAMATLMSLNRRFELVVARSIGLSAWQFLLPACVGALLFGLAAVVIVNPLAAWSQAKAESLIAQWTNPTNIAISAKDNRVPWLTQSTGNSRITIGAALILEKGRVLQNAVFVRYNNDKTIKDWLNASTATLETGKWILDNVTQTSAGAPPKSFKTLEIPTQLRPEYLEERLADPTTIPFYELPHKIEVARSFGYSANNFNMQLQSLIALPALLVAMTLIAATVSLKFVRFGQSGIMILAGILAGFVLYVVSVMVKAFGDAGYVPPIVAAWVPVLIAMFFGVSFLLHKEDG
ncbi:LPS export ABC transporter permease LptG [Bartonella sp. HY406]|uniref:LPS export ABC transporter permease LptG n=1 Tax=Bartonella sp. HY406 TaxID=2979331 RepID=UPI0021C968A1|nr:LPS export ABC transporter permease LptG [Bartonella sp. HY406]UXN04651.1 LPS export ABC transporter permease LptG [Bartonella sp. HY406]